jgi:hypothetical protein
MDYFVFVKSMRANMVHLSQIRLHLHMVEDLPESTQGRIGVYFAFWLLALGVLLSGCRSCSNPLLPLEHSSPELATVCCPLPSSSEVNLSDCERPDRGCHWQWIPIAVFFVSMALMAIDIWLSGSSREQGYHSISDDDEDDRGVCRDGDASVMTSDVEL